MWVLLNRPLLAGSWDWGQEKAGQRPQAPTPFLAVSTLPKPHPGPVESYRKIKEAGQKFEIIFVSADR